MRPGLLRPQSPTNAGIAKPSRGENPEDISCAILGDDDMNVLSLKFAGFFGP